MAPRKGLVTAEGMAEAEGTGWPQKQKRKGWEGTGCSIVTAEGTAEAAEGTGCGRCQLAEGNETEGKGREGVADGNRINENN
jgi:hypothetical protein